MTRQELILQFMLAMADHEIYAHTIYERACEYADIYLHTQA
jgi:hypothetical protein